jgi:predicted signal transduction protein with EAL and GGDEF domain
VLETGRTAHDFPDTGQGAHDGERGMGALAEVFVPLQLPGGEEVVGVAELYAPFQPVRDGITADTRFLVSVLLAGPAVLWVARGSPEVLLQRADVAMYAAKGSAGRVCRYDADADHDSPERLALQGDLPHALERALMTDPDLALAVLGDLEALGVVLSVDDDGTGYSSLAHLQRLPVDELKIDRRFVRLLAERRTDQVIVRSTVDLARNLGLLVVAEGVEDERAWQVLEDLSCDAVQGYHLARPMPPDAVPAWLGERERRPARTTAAVGVTQPTLLREG